MTGPPNNIPRKKHKETQEVFAWMSRNSLNLGEFPIFHPTLFPSDRRPPVTTAQFRSSNQGVFPHRIFTYQVYNLHPKTHKVPLRSCFCHLVLLTFFEIRVVCCILFYPVGWSITIDQRYTYECMSPFLECSRISKRLNRLFIYCFSFVVRGMVDAHVGVEEQWSAPNSATWRVGHFCSSKGFLTSLMNFSTSSGVCVTVASPFERLVLTVPAWHSRMITKLLIHHHAHREREAFLALHHQAPFSGLPPPLSLEAFPIEAGAMHCLEHQPKEASLTGFASLSFLSSSIRSTTFLAKREFPSGATDALTSI